MIKYEVMVEKFLFAYLYETQGLVSCYFDVYSLISVEEFGGGRDYLFQFLRDGWSFAHEVDDFGESSLRISLRYFIDQLDQVLTVDSRLRLQINQRFKEAGIVVAFPQRELRIDTTQPLEIRMVDSGPAV